jgi:hypothetical protein
LLGGEAVAVHVAANERFGRSPPKHHRRPAVGAGAVGPATAARLGAAVAAGAFQRGGQRTWERGWGFPLRPLPSNWARKGVR